MVTTEFIEMHSKKIRAWMISILLQDVTRGKQWNENPQHFLDNESATPTYMMFYFQ